MKCSKFKFYTAAALGIIILFLAIFYEKQRLSMPSLLIKNLNVSQNQIYNGESFGVKINGKTIEISDKDAYLIFDLGNTNERHYQHISIFTSKLNNNIATIIIPSSKDGVFDEKNSKRSGLSKGKNTAGLKNGVWKKTKIIFPNAVGSKFEIDKVIMTDYYLASPIKLPIFIILSAALIFFLQRSKKIYSFFEKLPFSFFNKDIVEVLYNKQKEILPLYKKSFLIVFLGLNIVFAFDTFSFMFHNHDWDWAVFNMMPVNFRISIGRYSPRFMDFILQRSELLPVGINAVSFIGISLAAVLLCIYWRVPKNLFSYSLIGFLLTLQPYIISWLFYK
ncbi:MAG: hypothetical protein LBH29_05110, partial [Elusimicrobiota bacterium]|nr:hypothetical protein [Elusimicrobiota bacterium]